MNGHNSLASRANSAAEWPMPPALALLLVVWLIFAWPWLSGAVTIPWDGKAHFAPQIQFMAASFARGEWPWWTPNVFAGHPQIADPQSMLFSPPFVVLALIDPAPGPWAIDCVVLASLFGAGAGTLWFARDLGWHWSGALIAAIAFAMGAAMAWRLQHFGQILSLAYLPFALLFLRRAILRPSTVYGALAGLFAAFIVLGRDQVGLLSIYLLAGYAITLLASADNPGQRLRRALLPLGAGALIASVLIAIPVLLTLALAEHSNRPAIDYGGAGAGSLHPALLITGLAPHLFGAAGEMQDYWGPPSFTWEGTGLYLAQNMGLVYLGALPLLLLIIGALRGFLWERGIRFFTLAWLLVVLYALGWYTPAFRLMYEIMPGVSFYRRPADAVFLIGGLGALLAGYSAHRLRAGPAAGEHWTAWTLYVTGAAVLLLFALAAGFALFFGKLDAAWQPLGLAAMWTAGAMAALMASVWLAPIRPLAAGVILAVFAAGDIILNNGPNGASALPSVSLAMLEPDARDETVSTLKKLVAGTRGADRRDRIEMVGLGYHWPNTALTHDLHSTLGANPVRLDHYVRATGAGDTVAEGGQRAFPPLFPSYRSPLANLLGLRFIVTQEPLEKIDASLRANPLRQIAQAGRFRIYENATAMPRVLFATNAKAAQFKLIEKTGRWPIADFGRTVLLEAPPRTSGHRRPGMIAIQSYRNNSVTLGVSSPDGGWAVLNDVWHPWWYGEIDGEAATVLKANVIFRAIEVPPGRHTVRFVFRPIAGVFAQLFDRTSTAENKQGPAATQ